MRSPESGSFLRRSHLCRALYSSVADRMPDALFLEHNLWDISGSGCCLGGLVSEGKEISLQGEGGREVGSVRLWDHREGSYLFCFYFLI